MYENGYETAASGGFFGGAFALIFFAAVYFYFSFCMYKIAQKCGCNDHAWWAWVPILNAVLMVECAGKPAWHFLILFVPIVNVVMSVIWWMKISENCGKPNWYGVLMIVPFVGLFVPAMLAFGGSSPRPPMPRTPQQPRTPVGTP
ncbi:MAG: DUF5684 domain-containing protein [bacterium]|nr:DUF5684 domain-containing protein [bacterium]